MLVYLNIMQSRYMKICSFKIIVEQLFCIKFEETY